MTPMNKPLISVSVAVFILVLSLFFVGLKKRPQERMSEVEGSADLVLSQVAFVQTRNGVKEWEIQAREARLFEKDQTALLKKVFVMMQSQNGLSLTVSGDLATMDAEWKDFSIQKETEPVLVWLSSGYIFKTSSLKWSSTDRLIQTEDPVEIVRSKMAIRGEGLKMSVDDSNITILRGVHAEVY